MVDVRWAGIALAIVGALLAGDVRAEEAAPDASPRPQFGEEIVVKGKRPPRLDTLEPREVREVAAGDLGESLDAAGGVSKVRKAGIANDIVLRGMKKDDLNVLIDGAKVHGACPSRMDPPAFHLDYAEVDRVEVKRGPFDVRNQGGLGGAIEVRTRRAPPAFGAELHVEGGSFGSSQTSGVIALSAPDAIILRKVLRPPLIATFFGVVAGGILIVGWLFNAVL